MFRIIAALAAAAALSLAVFGGDSPPATADSPATASQAIASFLQKCPPLKRGHADPIDGRNCVRELQKLLRERGYDQRSTGRFAEQTEANVRAFQRSQGIESIGVVGPKTLDALLRAPQNPDIPEPAFFADACTSTQCAFTLSRTNTGEYARLISDHPLAATAASTAILRTVCVRIFKIGIVSAACSVVTDHYAQQIKTALTAAAHQHACLRVTLTRPGVPGPAVTFSSDNSSRCHA